MSINPVVLSIPIYFVLIVLEWGVDLMKGNNRYSFRDALGNIGCGITQQLVNLFTKVGVIALYTYIYNNYKLFEVEHTWYWGVVLMILIDFFYYWAHRMSHEINLFWVGHVVHHQSEEYNLSVALRQGTLQTFFTSPFYWPIALLGFDPYWFLYLSAFNLLYQFWIHTEYIGKIGWLEYVLNTPSHHRVHHATDPKYIDKNHGGSLIIWDKMFGTFAEETTHPTYGITVPLNSYNPIYATVQPAVSLWKRVIKTPGITNKFQVLFRSPAWKYENEPEAESAIRKIKVPSNHTLIYSGVWFLIVIGLTANLLFKYANYNVNFILFYMFFLLFTLWNIGNLNDGEKFAKIVERVRISVFCVGLFWVIWFVNLSWIIGLVASVVLFSGLLLLKEKPAPK
ncbi:MAG: sterol desaturase family protein [Salibacteraceae bacterium]